MPKSCGRPQPQSDTDVFSVSRVSHGCRNVCAKSAEGGEQCNESAKHCSFVAVCFLIITTVYIYI